MAALIRWKFKLICQVMFNQLITGDLVRKENGLRWLTRQLKPLCRDLGSHPSVGRLFPSMGLQESSIMRDFILFFNVGYMLLFQATEMIRIWPDWNHGPSVLSHCYQQQLMSFSDLAGREWQSMLKMEACFSESCQHWARSNTQDCFLCQRRQLKHIPFQTPSRF